MDQPLDPDDLQTERFGNVLPVGGPQPDLRQLPAGAPGLSATSSYSGVIEPGALAAAPAGAPELGRTLEYSGVLPTTEGAPSPAALPAGDAGLGRTLEFEGVLPPPGAPEEKPAKSEKTRVSLAPPPVREAAAPPLPATLAPLPPAPPLPVAPPLLPEPAPREAPPEAGEPPAAERRQPSAGRVPVRPGTGSATKAAPPKGRGGRRPEGAPRPRPGLGMVLAGALGGLGLAGAVALFALGGGGDPVATTAPGAPSGGSGPTPPSPPPPPATDPGWSADEVQSRMWALMDAMGGLPYEPAPRRARVAELERELRRLEASAHAEGVRPTLVGLRQRISEELGGPAPPAPPPAKPPAQPPTRPPEKPPAQPPTRPPEKPPTRPPEEPPAPPPTRPPAQPPTRPPEKPAPARTLAGFRTRALGILREAARQPAARGLRPLFELQLGPVREELLRAAGPDASPDAAGLAALLGDARWHGILGSSGYEALQGALAAEGAPAGLEQLPARLAALAAVEVRFAAAVVECERAWGAADLTWARAVFARGEDQADPWFAAARQVHAAPWIEKTFADLAAEVGAAKSPPPTPPPATGAGDPAPPPAAEGEPAAGVVERALGWRERFAGLEKALRGASAKRKQELQDQLSEVMREALAEARHSWDECRAATAWFDGHPAAFKALPRLKDLLRGIHEHYFQQAFARASGPMTFKDLAEWCKAHGYPEWTVRVEPLLRLAPVSESDKAEKARTRRARARQAAEAFQRERLVQVTDGLSELLSFLRERSFAPDPLRRELEALIRRAVLQAGSPVEGERLLATLRAIKHVAPAEEREAVDREQAFRGRLERLLSRVTARLLKAVDECIEAGEPGLGFDLLHYLLTLDPDHERARRGLGHVQVEGRWLRKYAAQRWGQGQAWDPRFGWVRRADLARWESGQVLEGERWVPAAEADRAHAVPANPWTLETEHFLLRSTAPLARVVAVAERLEAFYLGMFSRYDLFFADKGGAGLVFGVTATPARHEVWFYRDQAQYLAHGRAPAGSVGIYEPSARCAYFYDEGEDWSTLQHELTHQILAETSPGIPGKLAWLSEGAAVYLENAQLGENGAIVLPGVEERPFVRAHRDALKKGGGLGVPEVLRLKSQADWNAMLDTRHYSGAGALVYFLCHADGGRYRGDLVRMLKDTYQGKDVKLQEETGLSPEAAQALMEHFFLAPP